MKLDPRPSWMFLSSADLCALIEGQAVGQHQPFQSAATVRRAKELVRSRVRAADHLRAQHQGRTFPDLVRRLKDIHCGVEPESFPAWITSRGTAFLPRGRSAQPREEIARELRPRAARPGSWRSRAISG